MRQNTGEQTKGGLHLQNHPPPTGFGHAAAISSARLHHPPVSPKGRAAAAGEIRCAFKEPKVGQWNGERKPDFSMMKVGRPAGWEMAEGRERNSQAPHLCGGTEKQGPLVPHPKITGRELCSPDL